MPITTVEITSKGTLTSAGSQTKPIANVFHYQITSPAGLPTILDVLTAWAAVCDVAWKAATCATFSQDTVEGRFMDDATYPVSSQAGFGVGGIATDALPSFNVVYLLYAPAIRSRKARGNKRMAGAAEASTTGNLLTGGGLTLWQAVATAFSQPFTDTPGNVWSPGVLSKQSPAVYDVNPVTIVWNATAAVRVNKRLGRLKRRQAVSAY